MDLRWPKVARRSSVGLVSNIFHWFHIILVLHAYWGYFYVYLNDVSQRLYFWAYRVKVAVELVRPSGLLFKLEPSNLVQLRTKQTD